MAGFESVRAEAVDLRYLRFPLRMRRIVRFTATRARARGVIFPPSI
jgi:hypothetical protein